MRKHPKIVWLSTPEEHDYPAAVCYLTLIFEKRAASRYAERLRRATVSTFKAKDILRASGLSVMGISNSHVKKDQKKILSGRELSPVLLVRDKNNGRIIIADGYHRICAVYSFDEDATIPCKIV